MKRKRISHKQKKQNNYKAGLFFLGILAILLVVSWLWQKSRLSIWDGQSRVSVIYQVKEKLELISFYPSQNRWLKLQVPGNTKVRVPFGYGDYQLKNVYQLGKLDNKGGELLRRTAEDLMAVAIDGWMVEGETNLSWWDKIRLWWKKQMGGARTLRIDLSKSAVFKKERLNDNSEVFIVSQVLMDELINIEFFNDLIVKENLTIAVLNASGNKGLAKTVARMVANVGGEVVMTGNIDQKDESEIVLALDKLQNSETVNLLKRSLAIEKVEGGEVETYRADVVVILGKDYASGLNTW